MGSQRVRHDRTDLACIHLKVHTLNQSDAWIPKTLCWEKETIYKILHTVNTIWFHFYEVQKQVELINGDRNQSYCFCGVGHCLDKGTREINKQTKLLYSTASTHKQQGYKQNKNPHLHLKTSIFSYVFLKNGYMQTMKTWSVPEIRI